MSATIEFIFDFGSPNAYLAYRALPPILERTGARLVINPCLLGGIFKATGNLAPAIAFAPIKGKFEYEMLEIAPFRRQASIREIPPQSPFSGQHADADARARRRAGGRLGRRLSRDGSCGNVGGGPQARRQGGSGAAHRFRGSRFGELVGGGSDPTRSSRSSPTTPPPRSDAACSGSRRFSSAEKCSSARTGSGRSRRRSRPRGRMPVRKPRRPRN